MSINKETVKNILTAQVEEFCGAGAVHKITYHSETRIGQDRFVPAFTIETGLTGSHGEGSPFDNLLKTLRTVHGAEHIHEHTPESGHRNHLIIVDGLPGDVMTRIQRGKHEAITQHSHRATVERSRKMGDKKVARAAGNER